MLSRKTGAPSRFALSHRWAGVVMILLAAAAAGCGAPAGSAQVAAASSASETETEEADEKPRAKPQADAPAADGAAAADDQEQVAQQGGPADGDEEAAPDAPLDDDHPFPHRLPVPDFPQDMKWLNTSGPLRMSDLRGKFVLFDFWTYCCINCIHVLPELKKLERKYPNELVVVGVHSAKFEKEKISENIKEAILRYEIEHPVVNDHEHAIWNAYGVRSWPTLLMIDPEGRAVWGRSGEFKFAEVDAILQRALPYYREKGALDATPIRFDLLAHRQEETPLRFPGKVLADETSNRLFIADSNHNRIVVADLEGNWLDAIGSGAIGANDGDYRQATFDHPQGMALVGETLYVADTENHMLRKIDLENKRVTTIAGTGVQGRSGFPGLEKLGQFDPLPERWVGPPKTTALNSPWALWVHEDDLYIAMAGPHQIWKMPLDESEIGPYAGNGREDIVDGPLLPTTPYETGYASFAQPSGLTSDGEWLYVADSEGSSIRAVPFDPAKEAKTVVGAAHLPFGRLFEFGDVDGQGEEVRLQHVLGVTYHDGKIYLADTYNDKVKELDVATKTVRTIAGGEASKGAPEESIFDEPAGIAYAAGKLYVADTNNHRIRTIDLAGGNRVETLEIRGLEPPEPVESDSAPSFAGAPREEAPPTKLKPHRGKITLTVKLTLPEGWKINDKAPNAYRIEAEEESGPVDRAALGKMTRWEGASPTLSLELPVSGEGKETLDLGLTYYYCQEGGEGLCRVGNAAWTIPLEITPTAEQTALELTHTVGEE